MEFDPIRYRDYIREKFANWRGKGRESLADFANHIHVSQPVMSNWYNGKLKRRPEPESYLKLVDLYGEEVYEVLGLPAPDGVNIPGYPNMSKYLTEAFAIIRERGIPDDSPEAVRIISEVAARHGIKLIDQTGKP